MREEINLAEELGVTIRAVSTQEIQGREQKQEPDEPQMEMT